MAWFSRRPAAGRGVLSASGDLRLTGVTRRFGQVLAVDDLSLTVPKGAFVALVGPSGCGKTTTLRMVAGLDHPDAGSVHLGDTDITATRAHERPVNTVFQSYALFPHLSVLENVAFGPRQRGMPAGEARRQAMSALELVRLDGLAGRRPAQLSGGQQQRVALARAVVNEPQVLLLDEPLGALDLTLRRQMQVELKRIHTELGLTFVHVTHDQEEAMSMATTVAVLNAGRVEQLGPPATLYDLPRTAFVANFLGRSNLVRGRVADGGGELAVVDVAGRAVRVLPSRMPALTSGGARDVLVGVRPEKVRLLPAGRDADGGATVLDGGRVRDVAFTGVSTQYLVDVPGAGEWSVFAQNVAVDDVARPGDEVRLAWDLRHTFALPGEHDIAAGTVERVAAGSVPAREGTGR